MTDSVVAHLLVARAAHKHKDFDVSIESTWCHIVSLCLFLFVFDVCLNELKFYMQVIYKMCIILMGLPTPPAHFTQACDFFIEVGSYDDYHHDDERLLLVLLFLLFSFDILAYIVLLPFFSYS